MCFDPSSYVFESAEFGILRSRDDLVTRRKEVNAVFKE
jgi:hypothetical protein